MQTQTEKRELTKEEKAALDEFVQMSEVLTVPRIGNPLPNHRKWTLPCPDRKALADHPAGSADEEVQKCLKQTSNDPTLRQLQEPQASETSNKQTSEGSS